MLQILLYHICQRVVVDEIRVSGHLPDLHCGSRDQGSAFRDIAHSLKQFLNLRHLRRTDRIEDLSLRRNHVRSDSSRIGDGAVNARRVDHMLSHIVHADIHDLHCV